MSALRRQLWTTIPLIGFLALVTMLASRIGEDVKYLPSALIGKPLPQFSLPSLNDSSVLVTQTDFSGSIALLNVWATWCPSCYVEHPALNRIAESGITIYGLNYKDERVSAKDFLLKKGNPYKQVVFDKEGALALDLGVYGAPETYLLDVNGQVVFRHTSTMTPRVWADEFLPRIKALRESQQAGAIK